MKHESGMVRRAQPDDFPRIMEMCAALHHENGVLAVDWWLVEQIIMDGINNKNGIIGVIGPLGSIEAMTYLKFSNMWYSAEIMLEELFLYVMPEKRKSTHAKSLLTFAKASAKALKCPLLIGVISNERTMGKLRMYRRVLGEPIGGFFFFDTHEV